MRVLITGGAGFIGSHLAEAYLRKGGEVYIIDNLSTGSLNNLGTLYEEERFKNKLFVHVDSVLNNHSMEVLIKTCDVVFHLAAAVGVRYILDHPLESIITNVMGTESVLKLCHEYNKKVLLTSSSEVYGKNSNVPLSETENIVFGPPSKFRWSYASSKLINEYFALGYYRAKRLKVIITRLFNTIGPKQSYSYGMVVPRLVNQAINNEDLTIYGDGRQTRTFAYVTDIVWALMALMEHNATVGEVFNVGGKEEISILDLSQKIIKIADSRSKIKFISYSKAFGKDFEDMQSRVPSLKKIKEYINFDPQGDLDYILNNIISYMKDTNDGFKTP